MDTDIWRLLVIRKEIRCFVSDRAGLTKAPARLGCIRSC